MGALILRTGIWFMPNYNSSLAIIQNPFVSPPLPEQAQYIFGSWLIHFFAHLIGVDSAVKFFLVNLMFTVLFIALLHDLSRQKFRASNRNIVFGSFLLLPAVTTSLFWVGMDGLTLVLLTLAVRSLISKRLNWFFVHCMLLALQHFEMAAIAMVLLFVSLVIKKDLPQSKRVFLGLVCMVASKVAFDFVMKSASVSYHSRVDWLLEHFSESLLMFIVSFPLIIWSAFGALTLFWLICGFVPRPKGYILVPLLIALLPVSLSFDQTRTFAIITFPLLVFWLTVKPNWAEKVSSDNVARNLFFVSLIPVVIVWEGVPGSTLIMFDFLLVVDRLFSLGLVPPDPSVWPFRDR